MAEKTDDTQNKTSGHISDSEEITNESDDIVLSRSKPDLGIANINLGQSSKEQISSDVNTEDLTKKLNNVPRKEESPFSFKHFLKRDLSLPGNSTYESTGAKPKVYANTVQHSPTKLDIQHNVKRDPLPIQEIKNKDYGTRSDFTKQGASASSSSSVEFPFISSYNSSESKQNLYTDNSDIHYYHRPSASTDMGLPSLPDFVQDHILVEQVYLNSNVPLSVDLDNLPDFTFSSNYSHAGRASHPRRNQRNDRAYDYNLDMPTTSNSSAPFSSNSVPLGLPEVVENSAGAGLLPSIPLDVANHLHLDLTDSINGSRRNNSPRRYPLDLPISHNICASSNETSRLPDFLPVHTGGRQSPQRHYNENREMERLRNEIDTVRSELYLERQRVNRIQIELTSTLVESENLRQELRERSLVEVELRQELQELRQATNREACSVNQTGIHSQATSSKSSGEECVTELKSQVKKLEEELEQSRSEVESLRGLQRGLARNLRVATSSAETSLRDLLMGLEQLKSISSTLDPP